MVERIIQATQKAKEVGTYDQVDRSRQYSDASQIDLLRSLNDAWSRIRILQTENSKKDLAISQLHNKLKRSQTVNIALTAIITTLAWKGMEVLFASFR